MTTIETKQKQVINITNIVFDDKLKEFIMKTKERVDLSGLALLSSKTIDDVLELQEELREYFVKNQYENMLNGNKKLRINTNNPDFYALFLLLISNVSDYDNWRNVMVLIKHKLEPIDYEKYNHATNVSFHCACGKLLTSGDMYKIYNIETKMMVWLGNSCILKDKIASPQDLKKIKREKIAKQEREKEEIKRKLREKIIQETNKQLQEIYEMGKEDQLLIQKEYIRFEHQRKKREQIEIERKEKERFEEEKKEKERIEMEIRERKVFMQYEIKRNDREQIIEENKKQKQEIYKMGKQDELLIEKEKERIRLQLEIKKRERIEFQIKEKERIEKLSCKCGIMKENICRCEIPKYKLVKLSNNLYCVCCNKWKCRCRC